MERRRDPLGEGFAEADLRKGLKKGGHILGAFIVERLDKSGFLVCLRVDWTRGRGYWVIRTWRNRGDRLYKSLDRAFGFVRRFGFTGRITIYPEGDKELAQFASFVDDPDVDPASVRGSAPG